MALKVGEIHYANMRPFFEYIDRNKCRTEGMTFIRDVPAQVNEHLATGAVDVAAISSFSYGMHANEYVLLPDLCVSSAGAVHSLLLFSKVPLPSLSGNKVALTTSSETTVHLLKLILKQFYQVDVTYQLMRPQLREMLRDHEAALLIGDDAIVARAQSIAPYVYDLGELWYQWTGLPMTYALFAVRKAVAYEKSTLVSALYKQFRESYTEARTNVYAQLSKKMATNHRVARPFWQQYFRDLCYEWSAPQQKGLLYYFQLCYEEGFIPNRVSRIEEWGTVGTQS
ncbi:menaquinone biosynthesis protein [Bacillus sp. FSL W7-1360]